nr:toll/interleukin-1 receptor-like protein [Ziziphus jujuba var. spinosa]
MSNASLKFSTTGDFKYDVFLSFRGKDTRKNFTDHLYTALVRNGFVTYKDDEEIDRGNDISPALLEAIQNSRLSIIVLSKNFAASSWCLDELVHILECMKARKTVLPIFYDVDPTVVRHQTDSFAEAFAKHEQKHRHPSELRSQMVSAEALADYEEMYRRHSETVRRWRVALTAVANLSGWHLNDG